MQTYYLLHPSFFSQQSWWQSAVRVGEKNEGRGGGHAFAQMQGDVLARQIMLKFN
jgi:hypothetical protein